MKAMNLPVDHREENTRKKDVENESLLVTKLGKLHFGLSFSVRSARKKANRMIVEIMEVQIAIGPHNE